MSKSYQPVQEYRSFKKQKNGNRSENSGCTLTMREDPHLGYVPSDWETAKVGELLSDCQYGLSRAMAESGRYPILRMNNIEYGRIVAKPLAYIDLSDGDFCHYRVNKGDVLFNRTNSLELVGQVGIFDLPGDFVFASYLIRLAVALPNDSRFINYYLNSYDGQKRIRAKVTPAIGQANVNARSLKAVWLPKPRPEEQKVIADYLDAVNEVIAATENAVAATELAHKALMQRLLTGRLKPDGTLREATEFRETKLGLLPKDWTVARVKDFGDVSTGKTPPTDNAANFGPGFQFITPGDLGEVKWIRRTERSVSALGARHSGMIPADAVCVVCIGATIGKIALTLRPACTNQQLNTVVCNTEHSPEYLYYALRQRAQHLRVIAGVNATPQLNKTEFSKYRLPMPATFEEERAIARVLALFDEAIEAKRDKVAALRRLSNSLAQNLLTGRVRLLVPLYSTEGCKR